MAQASSADEGSNVRAVWSCINKLSPKEGPKLRVNLEDFEGKVVFTETQNMSMFPNFPGNNELKKYVVCSTTDGQTAQNLDFENTKPGNFENYETS